MAVQALSADQGVARLEGALGVVAEVDHDLAGRAAVALETILVGTVGSPWQAVAWSSSSLTQSGYPVELAFTSGRHELRYAADVVGPEREPRAAFAAGCAALAALGVRLPGQAELARALAGLHRAPDLRYGVRVGGRHDDRGDRFKLYVEVPRSAPRTLAIDLLGSLTRGSMLARLELGRLRMLGIDTAAGTVEAYFRTEVASAEDARELIRRTALADRAGDLIALVEETAARGGRTPFRNVTLGVGVTVDPDGRPIACAFFRPARFLFSSDAAVRRGLLELCAARGLDLPFYSELTRALRPTQRPRHRWHGLLAWTVARDGDPVLTVGLAPLRDAGQAQPKGVAA